MYDKQNVTQIEIKENYFTMKMYFIILRDFIQLLCYLKNQIVHYTPTIKTLITIAIGNLRMIISEDGLKRRLQGSR